MFFVSKKKYDALEAKFNELLLELQNPDKPYQPVANKAQKKPYKSVKQAVYLTMQLGQTYQQKQLANEVFKLYGKRPQLNSIKCALYQLKKEKFVVMVSIGEYKKVA